MRAAFPYRFHADWIDEPPAALRAAHFLSTVAGLRWAQPSPLPAWSFDPDHKARAARTMSREATTHMPTNDYHFISRWRVRASITDVADVISDAEGLPPLVARCLPRRPRTRTRRTLRRRQSYRTPHPRPGSRTRSAGASRSPNPTTPQTSLSKPPATSTGPAAGRSSRTATSRMSPTTGRFAPPSPSSAASPG